MGVTWLMWVACGLVPSGEQTGVDYTIDSEIDRGEGGQNDEFVYPSDSAKTAFMYTGHGGEGLNGTALETMWSSAGFSVGSDHAWPTSFDGIRLFIMLSVGMRAAVEFDEGQVSDIEAALEDGVRFVIAQPASSSGCSTPSLLSLLDGGLGAPIFLGWQSGGSTEPEAYDALLTDSQPMAGVSTLSLTNPCRMSETDGALARNGNGEPVVVQYRPGIGGDLILIGDVGMLEDEGLSAEHNRAFARNLVAVVPD